MADPGNENAPAAGNGEGRGKANSHGNDSAAQRRRLLERLEAGPVTTIQARRDLDIMMPAARVFELRARGYPIATYWTREATDCGRLHTVARYALLSAANDAGDPNVEDGTGTPQNAA